jgi:organic radical activating enzyme
MADPARLCRRLKVLKDQGVHYLCLTGGEPLLYPALLPALGRAWDRGVHTLLCTNGWLLTPASTKSKSKRWHRLFSLCQGSRFVGHSLERLCHHCKKAMVA